MIGTVDWTAWSKGLLVALDCTSSGQPLSNVQRNSLTVGLQLHAGTCSQAQSNPFGLWGDDLRHYHTQASIDTTVIISLLMALDYLPDWWHSSPPAESMALEPEQRPLFPVLAGRDDRRTMSRRHRSPIGGQAGLLPASCSAFCSRIIETKWPAERDRGVAQPMSITIYSGSFSRGTADV